MLQRSLLVLLAPSLLAATLFMAPSAIGEEWTQFRGSDYGRTSEANIAAKWDSDNVAWKTELPGRGASSPVCLDGRIYLTCYTGYGIDRSNPGEPSNLERHLLCVNATDGEILWRKTVPSTSPKNPFTNYAVALHGYASSTAAVDKTGVYVFFGATGVLAFSHEGDVLWRTSVGTGTHGFGAGNSPILYKQFVIINASVESGDLIALKKSDGSVAWRQSGIDASWNTPGIYKSLNGLNELAVSIKGKILAFNPDDGTPLWSCDGVPDYICPSIIAQDGVVFAGGGRRSMTIAIRSGGEGDVTETHKIWDIAKGSNVSSPVYHDGHLYWAKDKNGIVYCVDAKTGEVLYEERLDPSSGLIYASPLLADGRLYYISRENGIYVLPAKPKYGLLAHTQLDDDDSYFNASPVPLAGGGILLRSDKYLYRLRAAN